MNVRSITANKRLLLFLGLAVVVGVLLVLGGPDILGLLIPLAVLYGAFRFVAGPLSRFMARIRVSIRWKIMAALALMTVLFFVVVVVNGAAMDYMHNNLHDIQALPTSEIRAEVNDLEDQQHGFVFDTLPLWGFLGGLLALGLGIAIGWSIIAPVRRMGEGMRRIASGDFSQPIEVHNRDELGELAGRINQTATSLAKLQEATLADERARALRERITQVTLAQEEERRRISRELHDGLGPSLAAIGNRLRACQQLVRTDPRRAERELQETTDSLKGHVQEIRHLIYDLRPLAVDQLGLMGAVQQQLERFSQETGIQVYSDMSGEIDFDPLAEVTVFRVVQECLSNVQKHANASQVEVKLQATQAGLEVTIQDDGQGFDPNNVASGTIGEGVGLLSMRERAELVGGRLSVESSPGKGCQVVLFVPSKEVGVGAYSNPVG